MNTYTVGQKLWFVPGRWGVQREIEITAVGRKWITTRACRLDKATLKAEFGGQAYLSRDEYKAIQILFGEDKS